MISDVLWRHRTLVKLINGLRLFGVMPLTKPKLTYGQLDIRENDLVQIQ